MPDMPKILAAATIALEDFPHAFEHETREVAEAVVKAVLTTIHARSWSPATMGEHRGRYYCVACTHDVDHFTAYVDWPCPTLTALEKETHA